MLNNLFRTSLIFTSIFAFLLLSATSAVAEKDEIQLAYVEWSDAVAATHVVAAVLEEELGYEVDTVSVSAAAMWQAVATGNADAMVAAWLPGTHKHYNEKLQDKVDNLGPNLQGTRIGLVVPAYVTIDSIGELDENAEKFGGKIVGIDPGAGIMSAAEKAVDAYGLDNMQLVESSGATMTAVLGESIRRQDWVVVTGWTPHWKFARWNLKYLEDPKGVFGGEEYIATIARQGLDKDAAKAYAFLDNFNWSAEDVAEVMVWNLEDNADPAETARRYLRENPEKVQQWLEGI